VSADNIHDNDELIVNTNYKIIISRCYFYNYFTYTMIINRQLFEITRFRSIHKFGMTFNRIFNYLNSILKLFLSINDAIEKI